MILPNASRDEPWPREETNLEEDSNDDGVTTGVGGEDDRAQDETSIGSHTSLAYPTASSEKTK